jgi:hypothetical protein
MTSPRRAYLIRTAGTCSRCREPITTAVPSVLWDTGEAWHERCEPKGRKEREG